MEGIGSQPAVKGWVVRKGVRLSRDWGHHLLLGHSWLLSSTSARPNATVAHVFFILYMQSWR